MSNAISLMRGCIKQGMEPGEALTAVNGELARNNPNNMFITAFIACVDLAHGGIRYANAGHNDPHILFDGKIQTISGASGLPLGLFEEEHYETAEETLPLGSTLFLHTDGVNEAVNKDKEFFGTVRLEKTLIGSGGIHAVECVKDALDRFTAGAEQSDDITMLSCTTRAEVMELRAEAAEFKKIKEWIFADPGIPEGEKKKLCLSAEECFVNICSYAYEKEGGTVTVHKQCAPDGRVSLQMTDRGAPFDQTKDIIDPEEYDMEEQIGGLGRLLARSQSDVFRYHNIGGSNVLMMIKNGKEALS